MYVNLIPARYTILQLLRTRLWQWSIVWLVIASFGVAVLYQPWQAWTDVVAEWQRLLPEAEPLEQQTATTLEYNRERMKLQQQFVSLQQQLPQNHLTQLLNCVSQAAKTTNGQLFLQKLQLSTRAVVTSTTATVGVRSRPTETPTEIKEYVLQIQGVAVDETAISDFVAYLRQIQVFTAIDLKSTLPFQLPQQSGRQFLLECRLPR
jgi:hypothetical protein